ncbi:PqqD family protein [Humibacter sp.]|uniref:PqqD family protein n=1 Tax=Humibacter sp. TaxID=1940291 RepID=UPI002CCA82D5|nr:PqqD family protein [Humibacter sp.]HVX09493.1 PqqD family protein [Humibacter sp.]
MRLRTEGITWQEIDGELVILDLQSSMYLTTNGSGAFLAKLLTEERTEQELASALAAEFDIADDVAAADTAAFIEQLAEKKLLISS